jgi:hypothetical protein
MHAPRNSKHTQCSRDEAAVDGLVVSRLTELARGGAHRLADGDRRQPAAGATEARHPLSASLGFVGLRHPRGADCGSCEPELRARRMTDEDAHGALVAAMLGAVNDDRRGQ